MDLFKSNIRKKIIYISISGFIFLIGIIIFVIFLNKNYINKKHREEIENLKFEVYHSIPSEVGEDFNFIYQFENYPEATVVYKSLDENVITSDGKVYKKDVEVLVWIEARITYKNEILIVKKDVRVKPYSAYEMQTVLSSLINIPSRNYIAVELPIFIEEYNCKITYYQYAQKILNGEYTDEKSIRIVVNADSNSAFIQADIVEEEIRCFVVAIFEYNGNSFRKNYPIYTRVI